MSAGFTHLHVASGYSLRHGASSPARLVELAAEAGMPALALTDRDAVYGAVKFVDACKAAGIAALLGVDLAVPSGGVPEVGSAPAPAAGAGRGRRSPARGGVAVDPRHPRVTVLALAATDPRDDPPGTGWARLCRLISAAHREGGRGRPLCPPELLAGQAAADDGTPALVVLLGPDSDVGRAVAARRRDQALTLLRRWVRLLPRGGLAVEVVHHRAPLAAAGSLGHAARMLALARLAGVPAVIANAVRHAAVDDAATVDVLDAARRLVPLADRHLDRTTAEGYLAPGAEMARRAAEVAEAAGEGRDGARRLLADTEALAARCRLDPERDLGLGMVRLPEAQTLHLPADADQQAVLRARCTAGLDRRYPRAADRRRATDRLDAELDVVAAMGIPGYFLTVAEVCRLIREELGIRVAARGSGAGSLINHLLGISGVEPLRYGLLMERFASPLRAQLPDIDLDVESARRTDAYRAILDRFGAERVTCVSMMDTYRVRHAIRDVGAALGLAPGEIDALATAFPHIRARDVRHALAELPELRAAGLDSGRLDLLFDLVERLDGLPRHVALHPCGVVLSDRSLLDRTPVEDSWQGFPMTQFDKDDVEAMGMLKLDVLGIRMQSAMAYAIAEVQRVEPLAGPVDLDAVPLDDPATFRLVRSTHTLGCFQIESPGQRELIGKFGPETFEDLIVDISLFRPGPVKSDMITPFLRARQGWESPDLLHPALAGVLAETHGVVVFHEQVIRMIDVVTGCGLAHADEARRGLGSTDQHAGIESWFRRAAMPIFDRRTLDRIWQVLVAFGSFGFCKAHAAAFALPTYQSAWLKTHHPAAFLAGVLTHDPGMYPKRLILDEARNLGIAVLGLDVDRSDDCYRVERVDPDPAVPRPDPDLPDGRGYGIRLSLADVKGISEEEIARIVTGRPYRSLADLWHRAAPSRPVAERLVLAGALDRLYGLDVPLPRRDRVTRRDLLLQVGELERWSRSVRTASARVAARPAGRGRTARPGAPAVAPGGPDRDRAPAGGPGGRTPVGEPAPPVAGAPAPPVSGVQLALDLGDAPDQAVRSGLPELSDADRVRAELEVLGLDASRHLLDFYTPLLEELGITRARDVLAMRNRAELVVAGVKVATQTPPVRSGRRVVFLTLDDSTGPVDATFFEDVQGPYAATVFNSWLLVVRGVLRRTGPRGASLRATGAWELPALWQLWSDGGIAAVRAALDAPGPRPGPGTGDAGPGGPSGPVPARVPAAAFGGGFVRGEQDPEAATGLPVGDRARAGGMGAGARHRRVLVHPSGYRQSPYADIRQIGPDPADGRRLGGDLGDVPEQDVAAPPSQPPAPAGPTTAGRPPAADGDRADPDRAGTRRDRQEAPRKIWHSSPGSSGR